MESDLLKKEDEFYKENEKLEKHTKELLQKVNDVMKIQDHLIMDTLTTKEEISSFSRSSKFPLKDLEICGTSSKNIDKGLDIPKSVDDMGTKGSSHFYRAKIKALQAENERTQCELKKKSEDFKKVQKENENLQKEKEKWFTSYSACKNTIGKLESQISLLNSKLQNKDCELTNIKKEVEQLKKDLKSANLNLNGAEVRLNRSNEETEKLRVALKNAKEEEKELKDIHKKQINDLTANVKQIEKHKLEILNGFKKQLQLIDNLKRQKMNLEALKIAEVAEAQYMKILDWKID